MADTVGEYLKTLMRNPKKRNNSFLRWPPDVFGLAGSLLQQGGAYCSAVCEMDIPAGQDHNPESLEKWGREWRKTLEKKKSPPKWVSNRWKEFVSCFGRPLQDAVADGAFRQLLLDILGTADSACAGISAPDFDKSDALTENSFLALVHDGTLATGLRPDKLRVLPKVHTPQVGMTLRSLSHNLALCPSGEVDCHWLPLPTEMAFKADDPRVNLLLIPRPYSLEPSVFAPVDQTRCGRSPLPGEFGFFKCIPPPALDWINGELAALLLSAQTKEKSIHGVVLPEGSLASEGEFRELVTVVGKYFPNAFVLAGVVEEGIDGEGGARPARNKLCYEMPLIIDDPEGGKVHARVVQSKHHRWRLDKAQMKRYGITTLDQGRLWWEHIDISNRELYVFSARSSFTFCFLICEDLARQEPVAPLVRAIGPDLIIALLQDGPQLEKRWPGRYATVLAEDPGSSVLTLSSLGMVRLSLPDAGPVVTPTTSRHCVGLWRDRTVAQELRLNESERAMIVRLRSERQTEYSADGRRDSAAQTLVLQECLCI